MGYKFTEPLSGEWAEAQESEREAWGGQGGALSSCVHVSEVASCGVKSLAPAPSFLEVGAQGVGGSAQTPDAASVCHENESKCVPLVDVPCRADFKHFPELIPLWDTALKEVCGLDQMGESHKAILGVIKVLWRW